MQWKNKKNLDLVFWLGLFMATLVVNFFETSISLFNRQLSSYLIDGYFLPQEFWLGFTSVADFIPSVVIIALIAAFLLGNKKYTLFAFFSLSIVIGQLVKLLIASIFYIPRPLGAAEKCVFIETSAFPSGHVLTTLLVLGLLYICCSLKGWFLRLLISAIIFFMALSRVKLGCHWPLDVIGSVFLGLFLLSIYQKVFSKYLIGNKRYLKS